MAQLKKEEEKEEWLHREKQNTENRVEQSN